MAQVQVLVVEDSKMSANVTRTLLKSLLVIQMMGYMMNRDEGFEIMAPRAGLEPATY